MKENICTIPINDIFNEVKGCPICRMRDTLEEYYVEYITGDAMMEPSVRIETNKKGFCHRHFSMLQRTGKKLPNALVLESHLDEIINKFPKNDSKADKKLISHIDEILNSCYVCDRIDKDIFHLLSTVFVEYNNNLDFRKSYNSQQYLCLEHYSLLMKKSVEKNGIAKKNISEFNRDTNNLALNYLKKLKEETTYFCSMFDYRNSKKDFGTSIDVIDRDITFLTGHKPTNQE